MSEESPPPNEDAPLRSLAARRGRISLIWLIPILAILLGGSLVVQSWLEKGPTVEIRFPEAAGIRAGATPIKRLNVEVGLVQEVRLEDELGGVTVVAELEPHAAKYLRADTVFWLVQPRLSLAGVSGIDTLLSGQYIEVVPADSGAYATSFEGAISPPIGTRYPNAKSLILETDDIGSIAAGAPISHRGLTAGEVEHVELGAPGQPMLVYVVIDEAFAARVRETSRFWNSSGIQASVGLNGVDVRTDGLVAMLTAGISFDSPDPSAPEAASGARFELHAGLEAARESQLRGESASVLLESRDATGLTPGTPIYYRGLEIGALGGSHLTPDAQAVRVRAFVDPEYRPLVREGTRFYKSSGVDVSVGLDGVRMRTEALRAVALGGVSIAVPEGESAPAAEGRVYPLYDEPEEAWLAWKPSVALASSEDGPIEHRLPPDPNAGALELRLRTDELGGLSAGSPVLFRSVPVGEVLRATLGSDGESVEVRIRVDRAHRRWVGSDTRFWRASAVSLDVGLDGVDAEIGSLRSLAFGGVAFANPAGRGDDARWGDRFTLYDDEDGALADLRAARRLRVVVETHESSLSEGAPVYFRRHQVGTVGAPRLTADARAVRTDLLIEPAHARLVRSNTRFWSPDAVSVQASLAGVEIAAAPLKALLAGGVMLATPSEAGGEVADGTVFRLEENAPAGWHRWNPDLPPGEGEAAIFAAEPDEPQGLDVVLVAQNADAIGPGDPVFFRGLTIGSVAGTRLGDGGTGVEVEIRVAPEYAVVIRENSRFWNASGFQIDVGWGGVAAETGPLETLIGGGVQVATPDPAGPPARAGARFVLQAEPEEGWQEWEPVLR